MQATPGQNFVPVCVDRISTAAGTSAMRAARLSVQRRNLALEPGEVLGQRRVIGRLSFEPRDDVPPLLQCFQCAVVSALSCLDHTHASVTHRKVALPAGISGIGFGEPVGNGEGGLVAVERGREVALFDEHVADVAMRDTELALSAGISWVGFGQLVSDCKPVAQGFQRFRQIPLLYKRVAERRKHVANNDRCTFAKTRDDDW